MAGSSWRGRQSTHFPRPHAMSREEAGCGEAGSCLGREGCAKSKATRQLTAKQHYFNT